MIRNDHKQQFELFTLTRAQLSLNTLLVLLQIFHKKHGVTLMSVPVHVVSDPREIIHCCLNFSTIFVLLCYMHVAMVLFLKNENIVIRK